jgi:cytochrome c-type biogenesis protein CcmE
MKKIHLLGIGVIAVAIFILMSTAGDASTYVDFTAAETMAKNGDDDQVHVVGELKKDPTTKQIVGMQYNPALDANYLAFTLVDEKGREQQVVYRAPKPQDMDKSEKVVIIGSMKGDVFQCDKILLKCPSKYNEGEAPKTASL